VKFDAGGGGHKNFVDSSLKEGGLFGRGRQKKNSGESREVRSKTVQLDTGKDEKGESGKGHPGKKGR